MGRMFEDRKDAGEKLALALKKYRNKGALVLAIPRGGVEVGYHVARYLNADFSIVVSRKLPLPQEPEAGFGAVAEDGSMVFVGNWADTLTKETVDEIVEEQKEEAKRRIEILRKGRPLPEMRDRTVILIDDGIAMGSTMRAAIMMCRNKWAKKIVVAAPVSGPEVADEIAKMVDEAVILEKPEFFRAVAQAYRNWYDLDDEEVLAIMKKWERFSKRTSK